MKRNSELIITLIMMCVVILSTACIGNSGGRAPKYTIHNPFAIPDGSGGVIVTYQINNDAGDNTFVQKLGSKGNLLWQENGVSLDAFTAVMGDSRFAYVIPGDGSSLITIYSSDNQIYALVIDKEGTPAPHIENGTPLAEITLDSSGDFQVVSVPKGEFVIAWKCGNESVCIQRYERGFNPVWNIQLQTPGLSKYYVVCDSMENTFLIWKDNPDYTEGALFIQKVDRHGNIVWTNQNSGATQGITLDSQATTYLGRFENLIGPNNGGAVISWVRPILKQEGKVVVVKRNVNVQLVDADGKLLWGETGISLAEGAQPRVMSSDNAMIILWTDGRTIFAQNLNNEGNVLWGTGTPVGYAGEASAIYNATGDGAGGSIIVWCSNENQTAYLRAQHLDSKGNLLWGNNGVVVSRVSPYWVGSSSPAFVAVDTTGEAFITWAAGKAATDKTSSWIQKISADGELLWGNNGIRLDLITTGHGSE